MPKYTIHRSVFLKGRYVHATPDEPATIEISKEEAVQDGLDNEPAGPLLLGKHYIEKVGGGVPTSGDVQATPIADQRGAAAAISKGKRAADGSPI